MSWKNNRPDDWEKIRRENNVYPEAAIPGYHFEAGADAMYKPAKEEGKRELLEALRNEGVFAYGHHTPDIALEDAKEVSGYWAFIPEENNEETKITS